MKLFVVGLCFFLSTLSSFSRPKAMEDGKPVEVEKKLFGKVYMQDGDPLKPMSMFGPLKNHEASRPYAKSAQAWFYPAFVLGLTGGVLLGYPAGSAIAGGEFNAPMFYSGLGLASLSMIMGKISNSKIAKAVDAYNGTIAAGNSEADLEFFWDHVKLTMQVHF